MKRCHFTGCGKRGGLFADRLNNCDHCGCVLDKISAAELEVALEEEDARAQANVSPAAAPVPVVNPMTVTGNATTL